MYSNRNVCRSDEQELGRQSPAGPPDAVSCSTPINYFWHKRNSQAEIAKYQLLRMAERGALGSLTDLMYARWKPLERDARELAHACNCSTERFNRALQKLLTEGLIIELQDGRLATYDFLRDYGEALDNTQKSIKNGSKGGRKSANIRRRVAKENNELGQAEVDTKSQKLDNTSEKKLASSFLVPEAASAREPSTADAIMPRLGDAPFKWTDLCGGAFGLDEQGVSRPLVANRFIDVLCTAVCQAAGIGDPNWRGDWETVTQWLHAGISATVILDAVKAVAAEPKYRPPAALRYFDQPVRRAHRAAQPREVA